MENENHSSGTNTVLIVVVLLLLVGFGVWWFTMRGAVETQEDTNGVDIEVQLPSDDSTE